MWRPSSPSRRASPVWTATRGCTRIPGAARSGGRRPPPPARRRLRGTRRSPGPPVLPAPAGVRGAGVVEHGAQRRAVRAVAPRSAARNVVPASAIAPILTGCGQSATVRPRSWPGGRCSAAPSPSTSRSSANPHRKELTMSKLVADMSMSLDGKIATEDHESAASSSGTSTATPRSRPGAPFRTSEASAKLLRDALRDVGALIGGRTLLRPRGGLGRPPPDGRPGLHPHPRAAADWPSDSTIHFVTDGLESAVAQAREAAAGKDIGVATPSLVRQCLAPGSSTRSRSTSCRSSSARAGRSSTASRTPWSSRARGDRGDRRHAPALHDQAQR